MHRLLLLPFLVPTALAAQTAGQTALRPNTEDQVTVHADDTAADIINTTAQRTLTGKQLSTIPIFNASTGFTELLTRTTPGVAADANGFAHPLGEHADTSLSLDGQPLTDQQAKVFANQLDPNIIRTMTATTGAPPAEFGDKTSLVVTIATRSGVNEPLHGSASATYGSFGTASANMAVGTGGKRWGEFLALSANGSGRFLDTPEFRPIHAHGNAQGLFNRFDFNPNPQNLLHLNFGLGRSWFQTPNSYDTAAAGQDQRSQIRNANLAFGWTHILTPSLLTSFVPFFRHDEAQYFPSANPLADATATLAQNRTLTNTGFRLEAQYAHGIHNAKLGSTYWHTLLHERFSVALTDPLYNAPCTNAVAPGITDPSQCPTQGYTPNPDFMPNLLPYDLTRNGTLFRFDQKADIAQTAFYLQDDIKLGNWLLSPGLRYDIYNGLSKGHQLQPRLGISWKAPWTNTVLRGSYARLYETPYNENLIFANESSAGTGTTNPFASLRSEPVRPGTRNQFNTGFQQPLGHHLSVNADYYWKFTRNDFDFDTLFNTPITFSVAWRKSKIDGFAITVNFDNWHGLTASSVMGHTRSRFFTPQVGGLIFNSTPTVPVFRIDHGEEFEHTTQARYQLPQRITGHHQPYLSGTWRYNSGLALPDTVPTYLDALQLTADEQSQMGLHCGNDIATPTHAIRTCTPKSFGATRIRIPAFGTQDEDRNPVRVTPRTLIDLSTGDDHLFAIERVTVGLHVSVLNATNRIALYNFLSTFSGTHFVPPRSLQANLQFNF
ncbi:MAG: TonB-dependent receptor [Terriglobus sp.]